jgi:hypothetical protein
MSSMSVSSKPNALNFSSTQSSNVSETPGSDISALDSLHADAFKQGLARILSTQVAEFTFSEILDGLPTEDSYHEFHLSGLRKYGHPVFELNHTSLCPGVIKRVRNYRDAFDPQSLTFPPAASSLSPCRAIASRSCC